MLATILSLCWGGINLLSFYILQYEQLRQQAASHATRGRAPVTRSAARNASRSPACEYPASHGCKKTLQKKLENVKNV